MERGVADLFADPRHGSFMDPGLSKTAITLAAYLELRRHLEVERLFVIAPLQVCYSTWPREIAKWKQFSHLKVVNLHEQGLDEDGDVFLCNPEHLKKVFGYRNPENRRYWIPGFWRDWKNRPDMLAIDETRGWRRVSGVRFKTLKRYFGDFSRRTVLTGSPAPNGYENLHGPITILEGGRSIEDGACIDPRIGYYRGRYFYSVGSGRRQRWKLHDGSDEKILEAIAPRVTCLRKEDWLDLPEIITTTIKVKLPPRAREHYDSMMDHACVKFSEDDFILTDGDAAAGKARQICNGFIYDDDRTVRRIHDVKLTALLDLLAEIGDHPTMIFYEFEADYQAIQKALGGKIPHFGKGTSPKKKLKIEDDWNAGRIPRLLFSPFGDAHGLNLQDGGSRGIWYNPLWDLELYDQAICRMHRMGQLAKNVMMYHLVVENSIEVTVSRVLKMKHRTEADLKAALAEEMGN
jgi:SNF2 family DNA or RNA helicase